MKNTPVIDSNLLIHMKELTGLTVDQIAGGSGVPLGTAQKILSGITKKPRRAAASALYEYMLPYVEKRRLEAEETVLSRVRSGAAGPVSLPDMILRDRKTGFYADGDQSAGRGNIPENYMKGNLARRMKTPGSYTVDDYRSLPDDQRVELIDGFFYELSSPSTAHQRISGRLFSAFYNFIREEGGPCEVFAAPFDVQLDSDERTMVQPDLVVICDPDRIEEWGLFGAPDLIVEILSPATMRKDRTLKVTKYGDAGVREYWMVDPEKERTVVCFFEEEMPAAIYPFEEEIPVGIYGGKLKIRLK